MVHANTAQCVIASASGQGRELNSLWADIVHSEVCRGWKATEEISVSLAVLIQVLTSKGTESGQHRSEMGLEKKAGTERSK